MDSRTASKRACERWHCSLKGEICVLTKESPYTRERGTSFQESIKSPCRLNFEHEGKRDTFQRGLIKIFCLLYSHPPHPPSPSPDFPVQQWRDLEPRLSWLGNLEEVKIVVKRSNLSSLFSSGFPPSLSWSWLKREALIYFENWTSELLHWDYSNG